MAGHFSRSEPEPIPGAESGRTGPRVLLIAESANPEWVSTPLLGWAHARALGRRFDAHLVTQVRNRPAILRAGMSEQDFTAIDSERVASTLWRLAHMARGGDDKSWTTLTALESISYRHFERLVWRRFEADIRARRFQLVHRLTPTSPTIASALAGRCARAGVPFVLGPLNGGLAWPAHFGAERRREREWLSYVRGAHRWLPGYRATRRYAAAIIVGSLDTYRQVPARHRSKCVYIPENAVDPARFPSGAERPPPRPLRIAFVGRLVPFKGADILLEAAAELLRRGRVELELIGAGPDLPKLEGIVRRERLEAGVEFAGWIDHTALDARLRRCHVFGFPSVREFGGGAVLEAMSAGLVPIVVDYGGPGELVTDATGFRVPIGRREDLVRAFRNVLERLAQDPSGLSGMAARARHRVERCFTWDAKAAQVGEVYRWVLGERVQRPDFRAEFDVALPE